MIAKVFRSDWSFFKLIGPVDWPVDVDYVDNAPVKYFKNHPTYHIPIYIYILKKSGKINTPTRHSDISTNDITPYLNINMDCDPVNRPVLLHFYSNCIYEMLFGSIQGEALFGKWV